MSQTSAALARTFEKLLADNAKYVDGNNAVTRELRSGLKELRMLAKVRDSEIKAETATRRAAREERLAARKAQKANQANP